MNNDRKPEPFKMSFSKILEVIKSKIFKITSFKIKENKALNETEFIIRGENKMTEGIVKKTKTKTKKESKLHPEIKQFMEEQRKFNQSQNEKWEEQTKVNHQMSEFIKDQNEKWEEQIKFNNDIKKFIKEQTKINKRVDNFIKDQAEIDKQMQQTNQVILTSIQEILLKIQRIEKCPTIKKELDELE